MTFAFLSRVANLRRERPGHRVAYRANFERLVKLWELLGKYVKGDVIMWLQFSNWLRWLGFRIASLHHSNLRAHQLRRMRPLREKLSLEGLEERIVPASLSLLDGSGRGSYSIYSDFNPPLPGGNVVSSDSGSLFPSADIGGFNAGGLAGVRGRSDHFSSGFSSQDVNNEFNIEVGAYADAAPQDDLSVQASSSGNIEAQLQITP
jgi:hypothetical protein